MQLQDGEFPPTQTYVDERWSDGRDGLTCPVVNPAVGQVIAEVAGCGREETGGVMQAAALALADWRQRTARRCAAMLVHLQDLATILTEEQGKPLAEAKLEITHGASYFSLLHKLAFTGFTEVGERQRRRHFQCSRAVRRDKGVRQWARRLEARHGQLPGNHVSAHGRNQVPMPVSESARF